MDNNASRDEGLSSVSLPFEEFCNDVSIKEILAVMDVTDIQLHFCAFSIVHVRAEGEGLRDVMQESAK